MLGEAVVRSPCELFSVSNSTVVAHDMYFSDQHTCHCLTFYDREMYLHTKLEASGIP